MKKNIINAALLSAIILGGSQFALTACANDMPYEPIFESMPITETITTTPKIEPVQIAATQTTAPAKTVTEAGSSFESANLQGALVNLDSAQVEIRNQLVQYRTEYTNLDNQYKTIKAQRKLKAKQVKDTEKRIKRLDSTKESIRKNMN